MARRGRRRILELDAARVFVLAALAGGLLVAGALFSVLLATGVSAAGPRKLVEGIGFSTGFFFVVLTDAVLFTEANVVLPATVIAVRRSSVGLVRFWALAWIGNFAGTLAMGALVAVAQDYPAEVLERLRELVDLKMQYRAEGGGAGWFRAVASGVLANWMVGLAAFFAVMGRTIFGKYIPVALAVTLFVAANFQHSPANMAYFSLLMAEASGPGWGAALAWNVVPAGIGNVVGGSLLVAVPFAYAFRHAAIEE